MAALQDNDALLLPDAGTIRGPTSIFAGLTSAGAMP
jgi:hypothetical protein